MGKRIILKGISILLFASIIACDKNSDDEKSGNNIIGKWRLIEVLADPGDGSGTYQPVISDKYIEFHSDKTITSNGALCDMTIGSNNSSSGTYSLADSTITPLGCGIPSLEYGFTIKNSILFINYPCIEPCGAKYIKF